MAWSDLEFSGDEEEVVKPVVYRKKTNTLKKKKNTIPPGFTLISGHDGKDYKRNERLPDLFIKIFKNRSTGTAIVATNNDKNFVQLSKINYYNCYINNTDILDDCFENVFKCLRHGEVTWLDKLVAVFLDDIRLMSKMSELCSAVYAIREEVKKDIKEKVEYKKQDYYTLLINPFRDQIIKLSVYYNELKELIDLELARE